MMVPGNLWAAHDNKLSLMIVYLRDPVWGLLGTLKVNVSAFEPIREIAFKDVPIANEIF